MITVTQALARIFSLITPLGPETVPLQQAAGRVLARDAVARRTQPPFAASAMDGYALSGAEAEPDAQFKVIGESAAGKGFDGALKPGQCVRIFTGAPVPEGATRIIIQEDVTRRGDVITLHRELSPGPYIRPAGDDFSAGETLAAPRRLASADIALLAAMNLPEITVARRPDVAIIATGNELVMPGEDPGPDQIIASNNFGLKALLDAEGAQTRLLPIARDDEASLMTAFELAAGADLIITIGGASVGDHDLIAPVTERLGMARAFYKVAMRPGKPLMAGKLGDTVMIGLPGNPVSSMVCGHIFLIPAIRAMQGLPACARMRLRAPLACDIGPNGSREHYMRARLEDGTICPPPRQDSALLSVLSQANALLVRPMGDGAHAAGDVVEYIPI